MTNMEFRVSTEVFEQVPTACFGVVIGKNLNCNVQTCIADMLKAAVQNVPGKFPDGVKAHPHVSAWRETFTLMNLNPNKFLSSVEALSTRVYKSGQLPSINGIVDLVNALSLKYVLPMGAHDLDRISGTMQLRLSREGDKFTPFGLSETEDVPVGEVVYADDGEVRTRRWVWRQGENAKIIESSRNIFFPIDGFSDVNKASVLAARDELAEVIGQLGGQAQMFFVDKTNPVVSWE